MRVRSVQENQIPFNPKLVRDVRANSIAEIVRKANDIKGDENKTGVFRIFDVEDLSEQRIENFFGDRFRSAAATKADT